MLIINTLLFTIGISNYSNSYSNYSNSYSNYSNSIGNSSNLFIGLHDSSYNIYNQSIRDFDKFLGYNNMSFGEPNYLVIEEMAKNIIRNSNNTIRAPQRFLPPFIDHRNSDLLSSVKYQGSCGTCVAFAALGVVESEFLKKNIHLDLSEKYLYFCNSNRDCNSGWYLQGVTNKLMDEGVVEEEFCPYNSLYSLCHSSCHNNKKYKISNYVFIHDFDEMKQWLANNGTLLTRLNIYSDFYYYRNGIYEKNIDNYRGAHAVVVVGYNDEERYWISKNSWGKNWGIDGYFYIKYGESGMMPYSYGYTIDEPKEITTYAQRSIPNILLIFIILYFFT